jgi:hypothetical protein
MPLTSTFLDEETMDGCIRKAVEWCEGLPSHDANIPKPCTLQLVHLDLSNNNLDSFLKNIGGPEKGRFTLLGHPSKDRVFLRTHRSCLFHIQPPPRPLDQWPMEVINGRVQTCFRNMTHYDEHIGLFLRENPLAIVQIN